MSRIAAGWRLRRRKTSPCWYVYWVEGKKERWLSTGVALADEPAARSKAAQIVLREGLGQSRRGDSALAIQLAEQLTLKQLGDQWIEELEKSRGKKYATRFDTDLVCYAEPRWSHPSKITSDSWEAAKEQLHGTPSHKGKPLTWRSIACLANTLRHFLRWCAARGAIATVPEIKSPSTKAQKLERAPRAAMDDDQREAFLWALALLEEPRALRIYTALFETWVRKSTLAALTLRWCDFRNETLTLPAQFNKSRREKVIDLTPRAAEAILAEANAGGVVALDEPVFGAFDFHQEKIRKWKDSAGKEHSYEDGGVFARACRLAGIDQHGLTPHHSTRHSALTSAGQNPDATISGLMAQAGIDTASMVEVYMKPQIKAARRITRRRGA